MSGTFASNRTLFGELPSGLIAPLSVSSDLLAANAVTAAKIATGAVTEAKLATGAVTETKLGARAVSEDKLARTRYAARAVAVTPTVLAAGLNKMTLDSTSSTYGGYNESGAFRTASSDYLVPASGLYVISGAIHFEEPSTGRTVAPVIFVNGVAVSYGNRITPDPISDLTGLIVVIYDERSLTTGDVVDLRVNVSGGAMTALADPANGLPRFTVRRQGATPPWV